MSHGSLSRIHNLSHTHGRPPSNVEAIKAAAETLQATAPPPSAAAAATPLALWHESLPRFETRGELVRDPGWTTYLDYVYGSATLMFPIDLRNFLFFYYYELPASVRAAVARPFLGMGVSSAFAAGAPPATRLVAHYQAMYAMRSWQRGPCAAYIWWGFFCFFFFCWWSLCLCVDFFCLLACWCMLLAVCCLQYFVVAACC